MKALILALAVFCCPVLADQMTVGDLQKLCVSDDATAKAACRFYIWGVTEGTELAANTEKDSSGSFRGVKNKPICLPDNTSSNAIELVVKMRIGEDLMVFPKDRDTPAVAFVSAVIRRQFACQSPKR
jgi:hypothetical protein